MTTEPHPAADVLEAIATLEHAAGSLTELDRPDVAHRCTIAAARLQAMLAELLPELESEEAGD